MKPTFRRSLLPAGMLASALFALPLAAQDVRVEYGGPAHAESEIRDMLLAALMRDQLGLPPAGWSHVVVYRPDGSGGMQLSGDGADLGEVPAGAYVVVAVPAGDHRFGTLGGSDELMLRVAPGRAYFIRAAGGGERAIQLQRTDVSAFDRASRFAGL
jgi:hypothetical protein